MDEVKNIHSYKIKNLLVQTGDILCLSFDDSEPIKPGDYWKILSLLIPGEVDHVALYIGPEGQCAEASARGVYTFDMEGNEWSPEKMFKYRGIFKDNLIGIAYPLYHLNLSGEEEKRIRLGAAEYCIQQAEDHKPYNINLLDPEREDAFYCGQLIYKAYLPYGIDPNTNVGVPNLPGTNKIVFPQEIWQSCYNLRIDT